MRNTDKLISLLTKKKTELDSKTLDELADHDQMIK